MKKIFFLLFISFYYTAFAAYRIKGNISDYTSKTVEIRKAKGITYEKIAVVQTDANGSFTYIMKDNFKGVLLLNIDETEDSLFLLANGEDIDFKVTILTMKSPIFQKKSINEIFQSYTKIENKENINRILDYIISIYSPDDAYYKATIAEKKRLSNISFDSNDLKKYPLLSFYINGKKDIARYEKIRDELPARAERKDIIQKIAVSGQYIETTNLLQDYTLNYFMLGNYIYKNRDSLAQDMKKDLDELLNQVGKDTERGQLVLAYLLDLLKNYGFKDLAEEYIKDLEKDSCKIYPILADKLKSIDAVKVGAVLPDSKLPDGQTIHGIKAKYKIVLFWSPTCPHCLKDYPHIIENYPILRKKKGELIAFGADTDKKKYNELTKGKKWINIYDRGSLFLEKYDINAFPTYILLDRNNVIKGTYTKIDSVMKAIQ